MSPSVPSRAAGATRRSGPVAARDTLPCTRRRSRPAVRGRPRPARWRARARSSPAAREREASPRANRSKTCGSSSGGMPGPSSSIVDARPRRRAACDAGGDGRAGRGVRTGVGEQVDQDLLEPGRVGRHERAARRAGRAASGGPGPAARASLTASTTSGDEVGAARTASGRPASSRASSSRSSTRPVIRVGLGLDPARARAGCRGRPPPGRAGSARRSRGSRPAGVRSSWLASATNCRTRVSLCWRAVQRRVDVAQHPVERGADLADLGARVGLGVRDPLVEGDLAAVQGEFGDPGGGGGHPAQRAQGDPDEDAARRARRRSDRRR